MPRHVLLFLTPRLCIPVLETECVTLSSDGAIVSGYNNGNGWHSENYYQIILKRLSLKGFIMSDYLGKTSDIKAVFLKSIQEGKLKIDAESETVIEAAFEDVPAVWMKLFDGSNVGKLVTSLKD